jgi:hypothetical protein
VTQRGAHRRLAQSYTFVGTADVAFAQQRIEHDEQIQVDVPKIQGRLPVDGADRKFHNS